MNGYSSQYHSFYNTKITNTHIVVRQYMSYRSPASARPESGPGNHDGVSHGFSVNASDQDRAPLLRFGANTRAGIDKDTGPHDRRYGTSESEEARGRYVPPAMGPTGQEANTSQPHHQGGHRKSFLDSLSPLKGRGSGDNSRTAHSVRKGKDQDDAEDVEFWDRIRGQKAKKNWFMLTAQFLYRERWTVLMSLLSQVLVIVLFLTAWSELSWEALVSVEATWMTMILLIRGITEPEVALFMGSTILLLFGIISVDDAFVGFSNTSVVTIGLMLIIVSAVEDTGALTYIARAVLHKPSSIWAAQLRMMVFVATASAFMNNTPLVAVMIPVIENWTRRANYPVSFFMIPLSYSAIVGGLCTIIGTSTNLIVRGLAQDDYPDLNMPFFEVGKVGVPISFTCILYCLLLSRWFLPANTNSPADVHRIMREYSITLRVQADCPFLGFTVRDAGLRNLSGLYLVEISRRSGEVIPAPDPETIVQPFDKLTFSGSVEGIKDLWKTKGLVPVVYHAKDEYFENVAAEPNTEPSLHVVVHSPDTKHAEEQEQYIEHQEHTPTANENHTNTGVDTQGQSANQNQNQNIPRKKRIPRVLVEVVLALNAPIVGRTVRESRFRAEYGAAILAIHRYGQRIEGRTGQIVLEGGDTLLLETTQKFMEDYGHHSHFALVSPVEGAVVVDPSRKHLYISSFLLVVMIGLNVAEVFDLAVCALACISVMYALGILKIHHIRRSLPAGLLLTVSGAFGIAEALEITGVAERMGNNLVDGFSGEDGGGIGVLFAIYIATVILTSVLSNSAAVTLMYPIADQVAITAGYDKKTAFYIIMLAGSAAFSTPIGYQTNLMVLGPGGYSFGDFVKFGMPLQIIIMMVTVPLCVWFFG